MQYTSKVAAVPGLGSVSSSDTKDFPAAAAAAAAADAVVFALGNDLTVESEGHDRDEIALYAGQVALVRYVCQALASAHLSKRVVAVNFGGGMIDLSPILNGSCVTAVLHAGYPSVQVLGVGDVVFVSCRRQPVSPPPCCPQTSSTRCDSALVFSEVFLHAASFFVVQTSSARHNSRLITVAQVSMFDFNMRPGRSVTVTW